MQKVIYSFICDNFFYYFVEDYLIVIILLVNMYEGWPRKRELLRYFVNYKTNLYNFLPFIDKCYNLYNNFKKIVLLANKYKKKSIWNVLIFGIWGINFFHFWEGHVSRDFYGDRKVLPKASVKTLNVSLPKSFWRSVLFPTVCP